MNTLGQEIINTFLLTGSWNAIAKIESQITTYCKKHHLYCYLQRTQTNPVPKNVIPYTAYIIAADKPGILHQILEFFTEQDIPVIQSSAEIYTAKRSGIKMCSINLAVNIADDLSLADLRERFILFCDSCNFDGIIEPDKN
jgi:glycine cleavage system transcriptional repressor